MCVCVCVCVCVCQREGEREREREREREQRSELKYTFMQSKLSQDKVLVAIRKCARHKGMKSNRNE